MVLLWGVYGCGGILQTGKFFLQRRFIGEMKYGESDVAAVGDVTLSTWKDQA